MEKVRMTNMCMIYNDDLVVVQERTVRGKKGYTFPGGHIELAEPVVDSVIREVKEETGLDVCNLKLCGIKNWYNKEEDYRYIVFLYKTKDYSGTLVSSLEGEVSFININELSEDNTVFDLFNMIEMFKNDELSEMFYSDSVTIYK